MALILRMPPVIASLSSSVFACQVVFLMLVFLWLWLCFGLGTDTHHQGPRLTPPSPHSLLVASRLKVLQEINKSAKVIPSTLDFYDIAGLVKASVRAQCMNTRPCRPWLSSCQNIGTASNSRVALPPSPCLSLPLLSPHIFSSPPKILNSRFHDFFLRLNLPSI